MHWNKEYIFNSYSKETSGTFIIHTLQKNDFFSDNTREKPILFTMDRIIELH